MKTYSFETTVENGIIERNNMFESFKLKEFWGEKDHEIQRSVRVKMILMGNDPFTVFPTPLKLYTVHEFWFHPYLVDGEFRSKPCEVGKWWGNETCFRYNVDNVISNAGLADGKWAIQLKPMKLVE